MARQIKLTQQGFNRQKELLELQQQKHDELTHILAQQMDNKDDEEDSGLEDAQRALLDTELRIEEIREILATAVIIEQEGHDETADLGATVVLREETSGKEMNVRLVSASEAEVLTPGVRIIGDDSPVGIQLMGKRPGDSFVVTMGSRVIHYQVVSVSY